MENDLRGNENWLELAGVQVIEGSSYSEIMTEIHGKSILVQVSKGSSYRESTVTILGSSTVVSDRANVNIIATLSSVELCSHHIPLFIHSFMSLFNIMLPFSEQYPGNR